MLHRSRALVRDPSDLKWFRNLAISHIIAKTLDGLDMKLPAPSVNMDRIRALYHEAAKAMPA